MKEVIEMLTENYLVKQGIMRPSHEQLKGDLESRNLLSQSTSGTSNLHIEYQSPGDSEPTQALEIELNQMEKPAAPP